MPIRTRAAAPVFVLLLIVVAGCNAVSLPRGGPALLPEADRALVGSWEGEFEGTRAPVFLTLHLRDGAESPGSVEVLGLTIPLVETSVDDRDVRAVVTPGPGGIVIEARLEEGRLVGTLSEGDERLPLALRRLPEYPPPASREEAWRQDLDALTDRFLLVDRSFTPAQRARFVELIDDVRLRLPEMPDEEIIMQMATAVSLSGNAHTRLYLLRNRTELSRLPIRLWWFSDGLYVVRATPEHRELLGCRVDEIGGVPSRLVRDRVSPAFAGNPSWTDYKSVYFMTSPEVLFGFGITRQREEVDVTFSQCRASFRQLLAPLPLVRHDRSVEAWWDLTPTHRQGDQEWVQVLDRPGATLPLYLRRPELHYWFEYLPSTGVMYVQFNRAAEMSAGNLSDFGERLLAEFNEREVRAFVLDLRFNTGGNLDLARPLMARLEERTRGIPRYLITGRATFSAGITPAAEWRIAGDVTVVGEEVGDALDAWSEGGNIILPNSRLYAHFANALHSYSTAPCPDGVPCFLDLSSPSLRPDLPVTSSWSEYLEGRDVAMEAIVGEPRGGGRGARDESS
jgi:hypothetical protein